MSLLNVAGYSVNNYTLALRYQSTSSLYGTYYAGFELNLQSANKLYANVYYSTLAYHSAANMLADVDNLLMYYANGYDSSVTISTSNVPISSSSSSSSSSSGGALSTVSNLTCFESGSLLATVNSLIVALVIALASVHVASERASGFKQLQLVAGTRPLAYWLANYLFDSLVVVFNVCGMVFALEMVGVAQGGGNGGQVTTIAGNVALLDLFLLLLVSCMSWTLCAYVWSSLLRSSASSSDLHVFVTLALHLGFVTLVDILLGVVKLFVMSGSGAANDDTRTLDALKYILIALNPHLLIKRGVYNLMIRSNAFCIDALNTYYNGILYF